ncbi:tetratricopeptide repeat protein [Methylobrevis albus]|uniref:Cellulose synthase n=1 Tax=Methylobrevis albus TaxID=2793297 RepID=A0A931I5K0_9HYPH|nr:cellulose synthase [Methylobrevis albus]MBH0239233.1 cellulose synthase [Methylobrevis albus]
MKSVLLALAALGTGAGAYVALTGAHLGTAAPAAEHDVMRPLSWSQGAAPVVRTNFRPAAGETGIGHIDINAPIRMAQAAPAPAPAPVAPAAPPAAANGGAAPARQVDETALRFFARQGDTRRLEAEVARLRALYPDWVPPDDFLSVPAETDPLLDAMWQLYAQSRYAELRSAIAERQTSEPAWTPPPDLLDRLAVAEARVRLVNASNLKQFDTVVRLAAEHPSLLTCAEVDVLWRLAEAFAGTERMLRAKDTYLYVLDTCQNPSERLATLQKALPLLPRADLDELLARERTSPDGEPEFAAVRDDLARQSVATGSEQADAVIAPDDVAKVEDLARTGDTASDPLLLGWYRLLRGNAREAERWFRLSRDRENSAEASQGLALALVELDRPGEAEAVVYDWRETSDEIRAVYHAAMINLLAVEPPVAIEPSVLARIVGEIAETRDPTAGQQLGWYAEAIGQTETAAEWFLTTLYWKPDEERAAYGLAIVRSRLGDEAGVAEVQRLWSGRSERIARLGEPETERTRRLGAVPPPDGTVAAEPSPSVAVQPRVAETARPAVAAVRPAPREEQRPPRQVAAEAAAPARRAERPAAGRTPRGCSTGFVAPDSLAPAAALTRGWCLMELNRPMEAAAAFAAALRGGSEETRRDAAYGQSLAYLRLGLADQAAVAATQAPQSQQRVGELNAALLAQRATSAFEAGRYVETILALDERSRIVPEQNDLMTLRGYAYMGLRRYGDARRIFEAAAATGHRDAMRGLAAVDAAKRRY